MKMDKHTAAGISWLKRAQDVTVDGGVSAWFSLISGWRPSYIETTGYIINTFFEYAKYFNLPELKTRAFVMADFLISMQLKNGAFKAYTPQQKKSDKVVVFDMGQDLLGMCQAYSESKRKKYLNSAVRAAEYLLSIQERNGTWIKNTYGSTVHTYHTRVAWGILEVYKISKKTKFKTAALKQLRWAQKKQLKNGWFINNELPPPNIQTPYTHTISYAIEGFLWSGLLLQDASLVKTALRGSVPLLNKFLKNNFLAGTYNNDWNSSDSYSCLTGNAQIALMWLELYKITKNKKFFIGASRMNNYLKSTQILNSPISAINGAIAGSDPLWGDLLKNTGYCRLSYLNWATKFFLDSLLSEEKIRCQYENL